jgi:hypothetical protein
MSGPEYDPEFEAYLRRRVRFDRRLPRSLSRLEPPEDVDRIVIAMAREAIQPLPNAPLLRAPRWAIPLVMAASVLVSFALMLEVGLRPTPYKMMSSAPVIVELSNPAPEPAPPARPESATERLARESRVGTPSPRVAEKAPEARRPGLWAAVRQRLALNRGTPHRAIASSPAAAAAAPSAEPVTTANFANRVANDGDQGRYGGGGDYVPASIRLASNGREMQTVVVVGTRVHFDRGMPLGSIRVQTYSDYALERHPVQPAAIPDLPSGLLEEGRTARPAVRSLAGSASPEAEEERRAHPDPKEWLEHIREVRSEGLEDAADQELKLFRDAYPAYPVP